jgi:diguanylate cyclase (GGDEF)-like protein
MTVPGTIKTRAILVCITTVIAFAINALMTQFLQVRLLTDLEQTRITANALRNHTLADMIHDDLRGIVYESLTSQERKASQPDLESDLRRSAATIHELIAGNRKLALTGDVRKALDGVEDPLNNYVNSVEKIVGLAFSNRPAAMLELAAFDTKFKVLETALKNVGDRIENTAENIGNESSRFEQQSRFLGLITLGLSAFMMLSFSWFVLQKVLRPLARIQSAMKNLASESAAVELLDLDRQDEIGDMSRTISVFQATSLDRTKLNREAHLLSQLNRWLQSCKSLDELYDMTAEFLSKLLPDARGSLYIYANSRDVLEGTKAWNGGECVSSMAPDECWGLRQGHVYTFGQEEIQFPCSHVKHSAPGRYCCIPILAHGETIGLLHLLFNVDGCADGHAHGHERIDEQQRLGLLCAEQISVAIANAKLRDQLRDQSIRDALTGLYNRRYMLDSCRREFARATRAKTNVSVLSIDIDHFKKFNDNHGHDAGDVVLRAFSECLRLNVREDDIACRFGGEEFIVALPNTTTEVALHRAELLRGKVEDMVVRYLDSALPRITISIGVASFPSAGDNPLSVFKVADLALYRAKEQGRNRVVGPTANDAPAAGDNPVHVLQRALAAG